MTKISGLPATYNGYKYGKINGKYTVSTPGKTPPKTIFRYLKFNDYSVNGILNSQVWASQPDTFNDIFDSSHSLIDVSKVEWGHIKQLYEPIEDAERLFNTDKGSFLRDFHFTFYQFMLSKMGVMCTTGSYCNELFWSYYNNHEGICLEYDFLNFPPNFMGPFPMNYVDEDNFKKIDFSQYAPYVSFLMLTNIKKSIWKHEDEYRFLIEPEKTGEFVTTGKYQNDDNPYPRSLRLVNIPQDSLKSITISFRLFNNGDIINGFQEGHIISFNSHNSELKIKLFDFIIKNNITVYSMEYHKETLKFNRRQLKISPIDMGRYLIQIIA